jgi:hypothetical protein
MTKFNSCTEVERRKITRSDAEFMYLMGYVIVRRCGFKNLEEAFEIDESRINIPRIKRGNELMWSAKGDPEPEVSDEDQIFNSKINELARIIIDKLYELYPDLYAKLKDKYHGTLSFNADHKEYINKLHELVNGDNEKEFRAFAAPQLIDGLVIHFLVTKEFFVNAHKRNSVRRNLIEAVLK